MAGGLATSVPATRYNYPRQFTFWSVLSCLLSASGGINYGYDLGITGGVMLMPTFETTFFPTIYAEQQSYKKTSPYCKYDDAILQLFPASLYIASFLASLFSSYVSDKFGRKFCMVVAGSGYLVGTILTTVAPAEEKYLALLIVGRLALGVGVGFGYACLPVYVSEMAPPKYRGAFTALFQWCVTFGILVSQLINYGTSNYKSNGWRISFALAGVPALVILIGGIIVPETPSYLVSKDRFDDARKSLQKIRAHDNVEAELSDITVQTRHAKVLKNPLWAFISKPCYLPYLAVSFVIGTIHAMSGNNAINFYSPQLFATMGSGRSAALLKAVILGAVKCGACGVAILTIDRWGRRTLLITGSTIMSFTIVIVGGIMGYYFSNGHLQLPLKPAEGTLAVMCIFIAGYEISWGPMLSVIGSEIQPAEVRSAGMGLATSMHMLFTFITGQSFLSMMCTMKYWVFIFFACICIFGTIFTFFFLPETKGLQVDEVYEVFTSHWFWSKCPPPPRNLGLPIAGTPAEDKPVPLALEEKKEEK